MHITIVAVGQKLPAWAQTAVDDFFFNDTATTEIYTLSHTTLFRSVPAGDILVAMDEHGRDMTTVDFAKKISGWKNEGCGVTFIIGGADGLDPALKAKARMMLRLSSMTLPHAFARVLLTEQIYRAWSILANHPYHRV